MIHMFVFILIALILVLFIYYYEIFSIKWSVVIALLRVLFKMRIQAKKNKNHPFSFVDIFEMKVDENPKRIQFITVEDNTSYTIQQIDQLANQVAHWGISLGLQQKNTIAIMLLNHPDYISLWLGFAKIGVSSALINTNTSGVAFIHSCDISLQNTDMKILIIDSELRNQIKDDIPKLKELDIQVYYWNSSSNIIDTNSDSLSIKAEILKNFSNKRIDLSYRNQIMDRDALLYIFTSGTTGMPKACKINQTRFFMGGLPFQYGCNMTPQDRIYAVLPMYHSAIGIICVSAGIHSGATIVLRRKFSASQFSNDCLKFNVTHFQYIGELCRYLVACPTNKDLDHLVKLKCAYGNGLRPEIWNKFIQKYNVKQIVEFYGATEGNVFMFNPTGKVGALGYLPRILDYVYPTHLIKTTPEDPSIPYRNSKGKCVKCKPNEVGMLVCEIKQNGERAFEGYSDKKATESKILKNVFKDNDRYFNTGDLLTRDQQGFFFWSDRTGDTFRWKGENVATTEVSTVLSSIKSIKDVTVYGVTIPECDGRAGMAVIIPEEHVTTSELITEIRSTCKLNLPVYSWPLFIRMRPSGSTLLTTSTFKHIKTDLVKEGFDPELVGNDVLYYNNMKANTYELLDTAVYEDIMSGKMRF